MTVSARLIVIAKAPLPGHSKTRLSPPCSPEQAARIAEAALADTLDAVLATPCAGRVLVLDGEPGEWLPEGFDVFEQVEGAFGERLAGAFTHVDGPALLIGMDTPQVDPELLGACLVQLTEGSDDAVLGPCEDGGYWAIGMKRPHPGAFEGVPMSTDRTGEFQLRRLRELGLSVGALPGLSDIDFYEDARRVAESWPDGRFAEVFRSTEESLCPS